MLSVSVVIPAYCAGGTIERAVDSVLAQTRQPSEIVIIDDGTPDETALQGPLERYGGRVHLVRKPNGGAASARNLGIEQSGGELIAFLDADDYWEPDKLRRQCEIFERHPEVGLVASRYFEQQPGGIKSPTPGANDDSVDRLLVPEGEAVFELATRVWTSTVVVRRSVLGRHRFQSGLEPAEDRDLWTRVLIAAPAYYLSERLATAVLEPGSLSRSSVDRDASNMLRVVHRYRDLLGSRGVRRWESRVYRKWAGVRLGNGMAAAALNPAWKRLVRQPLAIEAWWILGKGLGLSAAGGVRSLWRLRRGGPSTPVAA
jgi:glycosyltransferase involved in cell wall biosynthesis